MSTVFRPIVRGAGRGTTPPFSMRAPRWIPFAALALSLVGVDAVATTLVTRSTEERVTRAHSVVIAEVAVDAQGHREARAFWREGRIFTDVTMVLRETLRGASPGARFVVRLPGGALDGVTQHLVGAPALEAGEVAVVILHRVADGSLGVMDLAAGVMPLSVDARGVVTVRPGDTGDISFLPSPDGAPRGWSMPATGCSLDEFVARVRGMSP